jgi:hypothetical protein
VPWPSFRHDWRNTGNVATGHVIGVDDAGGMGQVAVLRLTPVRPNPFNPATEIGLEVPPGSDRASVTLRIYDVSGRLARLLHEAPLSPGRHSFTWDGRDDEGRQLPSGAYFLRATAPGWGAVRKITLLK